MNGDLLSQAEVARRLGVGRDLVRRWIASGYLPSVPDPETGRPILSWTSIEACQRRRGELTAERGAA